MRRNAANLGWKLLFRRAARGGGEVDARRRLWLLMVAFVLGAGVVFARLVQLEASYGDRYRAVAARPLERRIVVVAPRGRISSRDGVVLAQDAMQLALAVHYRYLEEPPNRAWLRARARRALAGPARRDIGAIAAEEARQLGELRALRARLAALAGVSLDEWNARARRIQAEVERIAASVRQRQRRRWLEAENDEPPARQSDWAAQLAGWLSSSTDEPPRWDAITVAEELTEHVVVEPVGLEVMVEIETQPDRWPGARIVERRRRTYPQGDLAAHVVGYVAGSGDEGAHGVRGIEAQYDFLLRGQDGVLVERTDSTGRVLETIVERPVVPGQDVSLALDAGLQRAAERFLDASLARRVQLAVSSEPEPAGGAIVALDVRTGAVLALASAPRFDPNAFVAGGGGEIERLMQDRAAALVDRPTQMAIPPGSVFKIVTAAALLEQSDFDPRDPFECRGYWERPDRLRCAMYVRQGIGHGPTDLIGALTRSCNVYFFEHAPPVGGEAIAEWARRFGLDAVTGIDLPNERPGLVPRPDLGVPGRAAGWSTTDTQALAIGQSTLAVTPLAVARMMSAVAGDGRLVTPRLVRGSGAVRSDERVADVQETGEDARVAELDGRMGRILREGLRAVVEDEEGSAHAALAGLPVRVAGKTGTAQVGAEREDHSWFAGYAPADSPRVAIVVALEHAGDGAQAAAPVARRLVERLVARGYLRPGGARVADERDVRERQ